MPSLPRRTVRLRLGVGLCAGLACAAMLGIVGHEQKVSGETNSVASSGSSAVDPAAAGAFSKGVAPFVVKYCGDCHSGATPEAKLDLTKYGDVTAVLHDRKTWRKVFFKLEAGEMPPQDQTQPKPEEIATVTHWIDDQLDRPVPLELQDPGRMTIRRLNRAEYNNTIRDLMAIDFHPADDFPTDDVGEGFDNIAALLSLSPILMEKYLAAAEQCVNRALTVLPESPPPTRVFRGSSLDVAGKIRKIFRGAVSLSSGELHLTWAPQKDGEYDLRVRAFGEQAGDEPVRMAIKFDGQELGKHDVKGEQKSPGTFGHHVTTTAGKHLIAVVLTNEFHDPKESDAAKGNRSLAVSRIEIDGPLHIEPTLPESYRRLIIRQPATDATDNKKSNGKPDAKALATVTVARADCARDILRNFANRAFRRPARDDELDRLMAIWRRVNEKDPTGPFDRSLTLPLEAVLASPEFLFRVEADPDANPTAPHRINDFELASRMSYFLWSSMPDDELFALAHRDELHKPAVIEAQVRRMIADPKSNALVDNFAAQWLQFRRISTIAPDKTVFPQFDEQLRSDMRKETEQYFTHVMRDDRSVLEFLDSDYTFLNGRLARFYGIPNVNGNDFRQVSVAGQHRGGLLTQSSILLVTSNPGRTSPVKRGKWILENLLNAAPPPPPANVPPLKDDHQSALNGTVRQRLEQHRANALCASCHKTMDPLGFGLENFDALGQWRTQEGKLPIDSSGTLPGGKTFNGVDGLKKILLGRRDQFCHCFAEKMLTYALGRALEDYDATAIDEISAGAAKSDYRFSSFVIGIVRSAPFQMRRGKDFTPKDKGGSP
jgi:hypothetical protein